MFGYITPVKTELICHDYMLYRAFYCGMCKTIGKTYGQMPRFTTNYDMTFLSVLLTSFKDEEPQYKNVACVLNPFKKKQCVFNSELLNKISAANIMLSYYKAVDGVIDKDGLKMRAAKSILNKPYKKVLAKNKALDQIISDGYNKLRLQEQSNCGSIDRVADSFATLLRHVAANILDVDANSKLDEAMVELLALCYNIGKFVYLADALDDIQDDYKKNRYNPFLADNLGFTSRSEFIASNKEDLIFSFSVVVNRCIECYNNIVPKLTHGVGLLQNIIHVGLRQKVDELLASEKKLKKPNI